jgi:hypothetical protein
MSPLSPPVNPEAPEPTPPAADNGAAGRQAVTNGKELERDMRDRLLRAGYHQYDDIPETLDQPFFIYQWRSPFKTPYDGQLIVDFYLWHPQRHTKGCLIEMKYQETSGSTDQKLHYTIAAYQAASLASGMSVIFVVIGPGHSRGAKRWCKAQESPSMTVITSTDEWLTSLNRRRLY